MPAYRPGGCARLAVDEGGAAALISNEDDAESSPPFRCLVGLVGGGRRGSPRAAPPSRPRAAPSCRPPAAPPTAVASAFAAITVAATPVTGRRPPTPSSSRQPTQKGERGMRKEEKGERERRLMWQPDMWGPRGSHAGSAAR
uniref:Uncharacterized protein n=1 Tax=Oryza glumipatula TaxID=40148 RepID=A0A0E0AE94_9ORYZ